MQLVTGHEHQRIRRSAGKSGPGEVVDVQYNGMKAEFVVVWAGRPGTHHEGEIGPESLPAQPCIWEVYLDRACEFVGEGQVSASRPVCRSLRQNSCPQQSMRYAKTACEISRLCKIRTIKPIYCY